MESLEWENFAFYNAMPTQIPHQFGFSMPSSSVPLATNPTKRSRASYQHMQNPCCQVEGCNLDLKMAKDYHRRHRICETHSKSPKVVVAGMERRFCQQCSRFHDLSEFDDKKRSCRRRLSDHNARRRRVQLESVYSAGLSPALYEQRQQSVLLNGLPVSLPNSSYDLNFSNDDLHNLYMDPRILEQCAQVGSTNSSMAMEGVSAHSLLSSNSWSMHEGEPDGVVVGNYSQVMRNSEVELDHLSLFHTNNIGVDEGLPASLLNLHDAGLLHHQEYQLFNESYEYESGFRSF